MRRKPMQNGGGTPRHHNNGGGQRRNNNGGGAHYSANRPRKNYPQLREKYLNQAKDALSAGDRVMAEYYFQHADHCYRMMMEEGYRPRDNNQNDGEQNNGEQNQNSVPEQSSEQSPGSAEEVLSENNSALPSFLTMGYTAAAAASNVEQAAQSPAQGDWEEN